MMSVSEYIAGSAQGFGAHLGGPRRMISETTCVGHIDDPDDFFFACEQGFSHDNAHHLAREI